MAPRKPAILDTVKPLVDAGLALHWLRPRSKRPYPYNWATLPVLDLPGLAEQYRPNSNVGVRLGRYSEINGAYLHIIDIDIRDVNEADEAWAKVHELLPSVDIDELPVVKSGSGGESRHLYIFCNTPFRSKKLAHSATKFTEATVDPKTGDRKDRQRWTWEIDLLGTGKQAAIPPSIHPDTGEEYEWERELDFDMLEMGAVPVIEASELSADLPSDIRDEALEADDEAALLRMAHKSVPLGLSEEDARRILFALPTDDWCDDRDGWLKVGMALHHEFDGEETGFNIWCDFSAQSGKFDADDQERVWNSFDSTREETVTMGFFRKLVADKGLDFEICLRVLREQKHYRPALKEAAKYDFMASEQSVIASRLMELARDDNMQVSKKDVSNDLKQARKQFLREKMDTDSPHTSIESWLAEETLRVFFAKGAHLIFVAGTPWLYRNGVWRMTDRNFIDNRVYMVLNKLMQGAQGAPEALVERVQESSRTDQLNSLISSVSSIIGKMLAEDPSQDPLRLTEYHTESVMNTPSGELWFNDGHFEVRPHKPDNRFTNQIAADFDEDAKCPEWDATLERLFRDMKEPEEVTRHLHEILGYLVQSSREQAVWVLFYGRGQNGKTIVASILQAILGVGASASMSMGELASDSHATAGLVGKLLAIDDDFDKNSVLPAGQIKKLSESKHITANPKGGARFDFVSRATPMILANHWPKTGDTSHGLTRRAQVFHFNTRIEDAEQDVQLGARIRDNELSGVLNRLIAGWGRVQRRGGFNPPADCIAAKNTWLGERNALAAFMHHHLAVGDVRADQVKASDVWEAFELWCSINNVSNRWGRNTFYEEVEAMEGVTSIKKWRAKIFCGLKLDIQEAEFETSNIDSPEDLFEDESHDADFDII